MTGKLPRVPAARLIPALERHGFACVRQSGSPRIYRNDDGVRVTLPVHSGQVLHPKILKQVLLDTGIDPDEIA
ncbi:MAG: addiction module toxin, HicA family [Methanospirillum sp.]|mgnify:CR=1 FL=1|nr:addiction module toxin, HicA family [Methanospirillum sp.]